MIKFLIKHNKQLTIAGALSVLIICYLQQRENANLRANIKTNQTLVDSLKSEISIKDIDLGRYEYMWDQITELHPKDAETIISHTE